MRLPSRARAQASQLNATTTPCLTPRNGFHRLVPVTTKHRFRNKYRLEVRERDHAPAHVHLTGGGFDVLIVLETLQAEGIWPPGLKTEVLEWVELNREDLMKEWKKWHK